MHNHCMSEQGMVEGFRFTVGTNEGSGILPISRKLFFRHSMVECLPSLPSSSSTLGSSKSLPSSAAAAAATPSPGQEDHTILSLLFKQTEVKGRLIKIMRRIYEESLGKEADFDCMPEVLTFFAVTLCLLISN